MEHFSINRISTLGLSLLLGTSLVFGQNINNTIKRNIDKIEVGTILMNKRLGFAAADGIVQQSSSLKAQAEETIENVVLTENFDLFAAGSEEEPDRTNIIDSDGIIMPDYVQTYGWAGLNVFQAGGCAYLADGYEAFISTPLLDLSSDNGNFTMTMRYKTQSNTGRVIILWSSSQGLIDAVQAQASTEWSKIEIPGTGGVSQTMIQIYGDGVEMFLDDVRVTQNIVEEPKELSSPENLTATNITDDSFTANWTEVEGATSYLLNVFCFENNQRQYLLKDESVNGTSRDVTGLESGELYFFTLRATDGTDESKETAPQVVKSPSTAVGTPVALPATDITDDGFTANWEKAENAVYYNVYTSSYYTIPESGEITIEDEDFSNVTEGTEESPAYCSIQTTFNGLTKYPNWEGITTLMAKGKIGLKNYYSLMGVYSMLYTPIYQTTSLNPGAIKISVTAKKVNCSSKASLGVRIADAMSDDQTDWEIRKFTYDTQTFDFTFTPGYSAYYAAISFSDENDPNGTTGIVYIDKVIIKQTFAQNDVFIRLHSSDIAYNNSIYVSTAFKKETETFSYMVDAVTNGEEEFIQSDLSNEIFVGGESAIETVNRDNDCRIYADGESLNISCSVPTAVQIYNLQGMIVKEVTANGNSRIMLDRGLYIVKCNGNTQKILIGR